MREISTCTYINTAVVSAMRHTGIQYPFLMFSLHPPQNFKRCRGAIWETLYCVHLIILFVYHFVT